jgi:hypothetical protein
MSGRGSFLASLAVLVFFTAEVFSQASPQAAVVAAKAILTLTNKVNIADVSLTANVTQTIGPDTATGTATLLATSSGQSRVDFDLNTGKTSEIRYLGNGYAFGAWIAKDAIYTPLAGQNCLTDAAWFFPALTSISQSDPTVVLSYVAIEQRAGVGVYHLQSYQNSSALASQINFPNGTTSKLAQLSMTDIYIDGTTFLPVALVFNAHPDNNATANIRVEIDYSNYQPVNGVLVPYHVQKFYQGILLQDLEITNVAVNTGLPSSDFTIQ